jgi:hypothetical protein
VHVDDARRDPLARRINDVRVAGIEALAQRGNLAVADQDIGAVETFAVAGQHRGARNQRSP